jgi:hypothetical protein
MTHPLDARTETYPHDSARASHRLIIIIIIIIIKISSCLNLFSVARKKLFIILLAISPFASLFL